MGIRLMARGMFKNILMNNLLKIISYGLLLILKIVQKDVRFK